MEVSKADKRDIHEKSWGYEEWIVNNDLYCGKRLVFNRVHGETSLHFHARKHETMWCTKGSFTITIVDPHDATRGYFELEIGDSIVIPPNTVHRITAKTNVSEMIEFSTHHEDEDSFRVQK